MNILDVIMQAQGGGAVRQLSNQFGLAPEQTQSAITALLPALATGLQRNMGSEGGLDSLLAALSGGNHQQYLDNPDALGNEATTLDGNGILGHILGSKDVSRAVAQRAAAQTGIDVGILKGMLPLVASLVMGGLSQHAAMPAGPTAGGPGIAGGLMGMLAPLLDQNRDGSALDDILGMAGRFLAGR